jgi:threonine/homoserine/homoserine lactone efflux protein
VTFLLFLAAASIIALSPGPGILYVAARTIVVLAASRARSFVLGRPTFVRRLRTGARLAIADLGVSLLLTRRLA